MTQASVDLIAPNPGCELEDISPLEGEAGLPPLQVYRAFRNREEREYRPLVDDHSHRRADALRRFALLWLLLDQLPCGSWGRSVAGWMREVWRGIPTIPENPLIEDEGGFETTVLNLDLLAKLVGPRELLEGIGKKAVEKYLDKRHTPRGFGTLALSRDGYEIDAHPRHTALAAWLFGTVLGETARNDLTHRGLFLQSALALLGGRPQETAETFRADRNPLLLYLATWHVHNEISGGAWSVHFTAGQVPLMLETWRQVGPKLMEVALVRDYPPVQEGKPDRDYTPGQGKPDELRVDREAPYPMTVPYGGFIRMEAYTMLSAAMLVDKRMPQEIRQHLGRGVNHLVVDYLEHFGRPEQRYTRDPLRSLHRGPRAHLAKSEIRPDLGTAAMLVRLLRDQNVVDALCEPALAPQWHRARHLLAEDLADLFDRYLLDPGLYALTHPGMLASALVGDHEDLIRDVVRRCREVVEDVPATLDERSLDKVLSERRFAELTDTVVAVASETPTLQLATQSLTRLLVDKLRPGRYMKEDGLKEPGLTAICQKTIEVYQDSAFAEKYAQRWGETPDRSILAPFLGLLSPKSRILDAGCGPGQYAREFIRHGHSVVLADSSASFLDIARDSLKAGGFEHHGVHCIDLLDSQRRAVLAGPAGPAYHAIWCSGLLVHLPREKRVELLRWFARELLLPGGILFVNAIIDNPRVFSRDGRYFAYVRSAQEFEAALTQCGFRTEFMLQKVIPENTHLEPYVTTTWANFYMRKLSAPTGPDVGDQAVFLTSQAYERSIRDYLSQYKVSRNEEREGLITRTLDRLNEEMTPRTKGSPKVLDVGCGPGDFVLAMGRRGWEAVGIDISDRMISEARKALDRETNLEVKARVSYRVQDFRHLPAEWSGRFHGVIAITTLHHVPEEGGNVEKAILGFARVLLPGGILRLDVRIGGETGYDPDLRFVQTYQKVSDLDALFEAAKLHKLSVENWRLPPKKNALLRDIGLDYATLWLRKGE